MSLSPAWQRRLRRFGVAVGAVGILLVGILIGGHRSWLPGFARNLFVGESQNQKVADQVFSLLSKDYYRPVNTEHLTSSGLEGAVASLHDPYSHYYPPSLYQSFQDQLDSQIAGIGIEPAPVPVHGGLLIEEVIQNSPAAHAGLLNGDVITGVNGRSLAGKSVATAATVIRGRPGTVVRLSVLRGHTLMQKRLVRAVVTVPVVASKLVTVDGRRVGYISFSQFSAGAAAELRGHLRRLLAQGAQGLVLDLRDNPGGLLKEAVATASLFISHGVVVTTRGRAIPTTVYRTLGDAIAPSIPLVVLVDRGTASSAEILTAALKDHHRALVVGTHTYGKGVFQEVMPITGGGALDITVGEYFTPDGQNLGGGGVRRGRGVAPNIYVYDNPNAPGSHALRVAERAVAREVK